MTVPGAVSVDLLMLAGVVAGGWQMARAGLVARAKLDAGTEEKDFYTAKLISARFFADHLLPRSLAYLASVEAGSHSIMALDEALF
jgi:hypothetical protein